MMSIWDGESDDLGAATTIRPFTSQVVHVNEPTLRDQFAMAALTGMCAHPDCEGTYEEIANQVYRLADAMMNARNAA